MTGTEQWYPAWLERKEGVIGLEELGQGVPDEEADGVWFRCPCGGKDHVALARYIHEGLSKWMSPVLNCYMDNKQWLIQRPDTQRVIREEEEKYLQLLEKAPAIVEKVTRRKGWSEETLDYLWDTHGIDRETALSLRKEEVDEPDHKS